MPKPSTYRFSEAEQAVMDRLGQILSPPGVAPLARIDVLRVALRRLADAELPPGDGAEKSSRKKPKSS